ncbi:MAG: metalloregulator ArsR/SmtB family transcription factor [SAR202 cluster bacterium]|jgi:DNA-binding transcriptional ArsR family regulator|nr:metalloregulator ArsR/SmtB family transcription factor [SAR202 cluster bacterium]MDP6300163.1 metalloregulator ArsR/SmtB family transcription factor [SAR202 cluster bacterium]MDP7102893.1 metalloregulator ArsR/SmtB family transcription factor [SAR202 cluster bacterium]MDP7225798.1 metalloregulator ArsR/SmtB family transcription factor [SAR202 cluster bacterium]MDP7413386.1 metalloregulator ArsR/SmtB family transcription factor [SAR202 cluster bacterium]|tara:strand:+ start:352 stop:684 length:333 start_codon:yes stop_codon:yes gene_type:complete
MTYQQTLTALADPTRRQILEAILAAPSSVGALAETLPVSRPAVSQHLRILKDANLVADTRQGTRRIYSVDTAGLIELRAYVESFWGEVLTSYKQFADSIEGGSSDSRTES